MPMRSKQLMKGSSNRATLDNARLCYPPGSRQQVMSRAACGSVPKALPVRDREWGGGGKDSAIAYVHLYDGFPTQNAQAFHGVELAPLCSNASWPYGIRFDVLALHI